jgi:putative sterol carrier protein
VGYFANDAEVDKYIGGMFRTAAEHPEVGPQMKAASLVMKVVYQDPDCVLTVVFKDPMIVTMDGDEYKADITLSMRADTADQYWRGQYNLALGLAKGQVKAKGPVSKILKLVPLTKPLFPVYTDLVKEKDAQAAS